MKSFLLIALVACSPPERGPRSQPAGAATPHAGGTLRISLPVGVRSLDPSIAYDEATAYIVHPLFDTLIDYGVLDLTIRPRLAERWEISPDGRTYRFWLRPGITYNEGTPIVAADFVYSLERALSTAESPFGPYLGEVEGAAELVAGKAAHCVGISAPSERELVIRLTRSNAAFLHVLTMTFATPQRADHVAAAGNQLRRTPLASGPYELESWDEGERIVLRRNPRYDDPARGRIDSLIVLENIPNDTQFLMFERGDLDTAEHLAAPDKLWLATQPAWAPYVHKRALMSVFGMRMNVRKKPFDDRRVRQAFNYALDKDHVVKLLNGGAVPAHGILPPDMLGRDDTLAPYPHDPAKARALLAAAGYPDGFDVDYVTTNDDEAERIAASLQADLAEVGVRVHVSLVSFATWITAIGKPDGAAFSLATWLGDFPDPTNFLDVKFHSRAIAEDNSQNDSFYANPELDALLDAAREQLDPVARSALYHRAEHILYDDAPWVWGYHQLMVEVTQPYVRDYEPHPVRIRDYTSAWLDLGPDGEPVPR